MARRRRRDYLAFRPEGLCLQRYLRRRRVRLSTRFRPRPESRFAFRHSGPRAAGDELGQGNKANGQKLFRSARQLERQAHRRDLTSLPRPGLLLLPARDNHLSHCRPFLVRIVAGPGTREHSQAVAGR
jgi:hypothetical protein